MQYNDMKLLFFQLLDMEISIFFVACDYISSFI